MSSACFVMSAILHHIVLGGWPKELIMLHAVFCQLSMGGLNSSGSGGDGEAKFISISYAERCHIVWEACP